MSEHQVIIVGAGPGGISAALALKDAGIRPLVVDRADQVAASWRSRYDRLRLNSWGPLSHLPGRRFAKGTAKYPSRDELVAHIEAGASEDGVDLRLGTAVERIDRNGSGWIVRTSAGEIAAPHVIVATGYENIPVIPEWEGRERFRGELIHSSAYRNAQPYAGKRVLVVGPGCSGMEIAYDLAEGGAAQVWLAVRTPPNMVLRVGPGGLPGDVIGKALFRLPTRMGDAMAKFGRKQDMGDLTEYGLPFPEEGLFSRFRREHTVPSIIDKEVVEAIKDRRIEIVRAVDRLDETGVVTAGGGRVEPDVVICATGTERGLEPLVGHLGVLDDHGVPRAAPPAPAADGLRFIGYQPRVGVLGYMAVEARRTAKAIKRELRG